MRAGELCEGKSERHIVAEQLQMVIPFLGTCARTYGRVFFVLTQSIIFYLHGRRFVCRQQLKRERKNALPKGLFFIWFFAIVQVLLELRRWYLSTQ